MDSKIHEYEIDYGNFISDDFSGQFAKREVRMFLKPELLTRLGPYTFIRNKIYCLRLI